MVFYCMEDGDKAATMSLRDKPYTKVMVEDKEAAAEDVRKPMQGTRRPTS